MNHLREAEWITVHGLVAMLAVAIFALGSRARGQRRHPSAAMAWVVSLALMPYVAIPLYLLFGNRKVVRGRTASRQATARRADAAGDTPSARCRELADAMGLPAACSYHQLVIHDDGGAALQALRALMQHATRTLDVCTFLLGRDPLGDEVAALLVQRAQSGVRVRLIVDGVGRYLGGRPDLDRLRAAGVKVAVFVPPFRSALPGRTNLRNHRKLVIADGHHTWTGGRNLATEYFTGTAPAQGHALPPWFDLSFDFRGELAHQTQSRFDADWAFANPGSVFPVDALVPADKDTGALAGDPPCAQLIASGPDQADDTLYALLISSCFTARSRITAVSPYFVPDGLLMMALSLAARRGVAVDVVLPARSNHRLADLARHAALRDLVAEGARVWLVPDMVHAKAVLIDDDLALAGSANLDERSLFLNYELTIAFYAPADVARFSQWVDRLRARAVPYAVQTPGLWRQATEGFVRWLAFQL